MLTATVGKSLITKGYCKRLRTHSRRSERPKIMGVWRCKVSLRYGIRNNVGLYRCRLCGGDVFLSVSRHFRPEGEHTIAVEDLFAGYFETVLAKNELIAELQIPAQGKTRAAYLKVTTGSAEDWPALGVAVAIRGRQLGGQVHPRRSRPHSNWDMRWSGWRNTYTTLPGVALPSSGRVRSTATVPSIVLTFAVTIPAPREHRGQPPTFR